MGRPNRCITSSSLSAWSISVAAALISLLGLAPRLGADPAAHRMAATSEHPVVTSVALSILRRGGSALDAAVAATLAAGVVSPMSSGLGGGGFALWYDSALASAEFWDFRETAPRRIDPRQLARKDRDRSGRHGALIGVPGEPRGLFELHRCHGRLAWRELVEPAARLALEGYPAGPHLVRAVGRLRNGRPRGRVVMRSLGFPWHGMAVGLVLFRPRLGRTLKAYQAEGPDAITHGAIARDLVNATRKHGGTLSLDDLAEYRPVLRAPLSTQWGNLRVLTAPPPSAGGLLLAQTLGTFSKQDLRNHASREKRLGLLSQSFLASFEDRRRYVGDPARVDMDLEALLDPARLAARRRSFDQPVPATPVTLVPDHGTHHLAVVDARGDIVSLTTTINHSFGVRVVAPLSGIVLNDELDDFSTRTKSDPGDFSSDPNRPAPRVRPVSSMSPTLVLDRAGPRWVLGGSGGMAISTNVTQVLIALSVDGIDPQDAVDAPRFLVNPATGALRVEPGFDPDAVDALRRRGIPVEFIDRTMTAVQLLARTDGGWQAVADPRKFGSGGTE